MYGNYNNGHAPFLLMDSVWKRDEWHLGVTEVFMADENRKAFSITVNTEYKNW